MFLRNDQVFGNKITLLTNNPLHMDQLGRNVGKEKSGVEESFGEVLAKAFNNVNDKQLATTEMAEKMITEPDSVNVHDIMTAVAEANLSISMTKNIVDRAVRAYKEIIAVR
jgi:flagellar hook-basal body complex protein FliE